MTPDTLLGALEIHLGALTDAPRVMRAGSFDHARHLCSEAKNANVMIFVGKLTAQAPTDWQTTHQWGQWELGLLLQNQQRNRPRMGHPDRSYNDLRNTLIPHLIGWSPADYATPLRLQYAEAPPMPEPHHAFLLVYTTRCLLNGAC